MSTPQKPEPSGERGEYQHPDTSAPYAKQYDVPSKSSYAPSPSGSVAKQLERYANDPMWADHAEVPKAFCRVAAEVFKRMEQERADAVAENDELIAIHGQLTEANQRLSLEVGRLREREDLVKSLLTAWENNEHEINQMGVAAFLAVHFGMCPDDSSWHFGVYDRIRNCLAGGAEK